MMRYVVIPGLCAVLACKQREPPPASSLNSARPDSVAQTAESISAPPAFEPDHPLLVAIRQRGGSQVTNATIADERSVNNFRGRHHIVVIRSVYRDRYINFSVHVTDSTMTSTVRAVAFLTAPWPDYEVRIDSVTADSVYLTGTSPAYRRTVSSVFPWVPLNVGPRLPRIERPASALTTPACGATVRLDLDARTIAGIWMNQSIDSLKREVGAANVVTDTGYPEGQAQEEYLIKLCGHEIRRTWNAVSWTDSAFRTAEGLGVGSTLAAFDTLHGTGEATGEEGNSVRYSPINGIGHFFVDVAGACYSVVNQRLEVNRSCRATGLAMIVFEPQKD